MEDNICTEVLKLITNSDEPLETKDIREKLELKLNNESITRTKVFYRLNLLRGEGKIKGNFKGSGKGVWIWWRADAFLRQRTLGDFSNVINIEESNK